MQSSAVAKANLGEQSGFTLVELVATIILIGIVAVTVVPRFSGAGTYSEYALRDQFVSAFRFAQQRAMYDHQAQSCYRVVVEADQLGPQRSFDGGVTFEYFGPNSLNDGADSQQKITAPISMTTAEIYFDGLGNAIPAATTPCTGTPARIQISINSEVTLHSCVLGTGFVEKFACP